MWYIVNKRIQKMYIFTFFLSFLWYRLNMTYKSSTILKRIFYIPLLLTETIIGNIILVILTIPALTGIKLLYPSFMEKDKADVFIPLFTLIYFALQIGFSIYYNGAIWLWYKKYKQLTGQRYKFFKLYSIDNIYLAFYHSFPMRLYPFIACFLIPYYPNFLSFLLFTIFWMIIHYFWIEWHRKRIMFRYDAPQKFYPVFILSAYLVLFLTPGVVTFLHAIYNAFF